MDRIHHLLRVLYFSTDQKMSKYLHMYMPKIIYQS